MTCPRGSCVGQNIPPGWFDQKNCCNARKQSYEWVVLHEGWRAQGRDAYEPCISKNKHIFAIISSMVLQHIVQSLHPTKHENIF